MSLLQNINSTAKYRATGSKPSRPTSLNPTMNQFDFEDDSYDAEEERDVENQDSDEDTEDASETDMVKCKDEKEEYTELKEQMYQDKLQTLKRQLQQLAEGSHPEYVKHLKKLEHLYQERIKLNEAFYHFELELVEKEYGYEKKSAAREFEEKKVELRENLIADLEEKKNSIKNERHNMELTGADSMELKTISTRKLRRRPNEPIPLPEKRRKTSPNQFSFLLNDEEIMEDLRFISKDKYASPKRPVIDDAQILTDLPPYEAKIEDGKLYFAKRWFHRGQPVFVDSRETGRFAGVISAIGNSEVWIRKTADNAKVGIYIAHLQRGKFNIKRR